MCEEVRAARELRSLDRERAADAGRVLGGRNDMKKKRLMGCVAVLALLSVLANAEDGRQGKHAIFDGALLIDNMDVELLDELVLGITLDEDAVTSWPFPDPDEPYSPDGLCIWVVGAHIICIKKADPVPPPACDPSWCDPPMPIDDQKWMRNLLLKHNEPWNRDLTWMDDLSESPVIPLRQKRHEHRVPG